MSNLIPKGHALRLTLNCADCDNWYKPELGQATELTIYHNTEYPSHLVLPVVE